METKTSCMDVVSIRGIRTWWIYVVEILEITKYSSYSKWNTKLSVCRRRF